MHYKRILILLLINLFGWWTYAFSQSGDDTLNTLRGDTIKPLEFTPEAASAYLSGLLNHELFWKREMIPYGYPLQGFSINTVSLSTASRVD